MNSLLSKSFFIEEKNHHLYLKMSIEDKKTSNLPWTVKYIPKTFDDFYGNAMTVKILKAYLKSDYLPSLLFYGPPGTGKTSLSQLVYTTLYGTSVSSMVLKINTTEDVQLDLLHKRIVQFATTRNLFQNTKRKLIIVDDVDNITTEMQILFSDMIDFLTKDVFFIFCSNNQSSFIASFTSRIVSILLSPISIADATTVVKNILMKESANSSSFLFTEREEKSIQMLYNRMGGDLRKIVNCIQAVYCHHDFETENDKTMMLSKKSMDTIFLLHQQEDLQTFVHILHEKELKEAVSFLTDCINNKSQDFRVWMGLVFEYILSLIDVRSPKFQQPFIDYVTNLSEIEYNSSFLVDFRVQLYAFVALTRQLLQTV
jgi:DNA polymerase III delta prime subunit